MGFKQISRTGIYALNPMHKRPIRLFEIATLGLGVADLLRSRWQKHKQEYGRERVKLASQDASPSALCSFS